MKRLVLLALLTTGCDKPPAPAAGPGAPGSATTAPAAASTPEPKGEFTYHFGADENHTTIRFESKTDVTNILGVSRRVEGSATIDFEKGAGKCHLVVPAMALRTGMDDRDRAMLGKTWLDAKQFPTIEFTADRATKTGPSDWRLDGEFLLHGVKKPLSVPVQVKRVPSVLAELLGKGEWIRIRTEFKVALADHSIKIEGTAGATVDPVWNVAIELFAGTVKPPPPPPVEDINQKNPERVVRVPAPEKEGLPGKIYKFGSKSQFVTLKAESLMEVENVTATTSALAGWVGIDKEKGLGGVRLRTLVAQLKTGNNERDKHLQSADWLDAEKFKDMTFESTKAAKKDGTAWTVEGNFTMHGVARPVTLEVTAREIPLEIIQKAKWGDKPGLAFSGSFKVKLSDHGVKIPQIAVAKVNDQWTISFDLVALLEE